MRFDLRSLIDPELWDLADESHAFYANRQSRSGPSSPEELQAFRAEMPAPSISDPPPILEKVSAGERSVPVRIHMPMNDEPSTGVLLEIHTGGFFMGSAAGSDLRNRRLANALGVAVVSVDYRLAPECPWPAAPDDCETVASWLVDQSEARFDTTKLLISGFSAGATLAMSTLLRMRDRGVNAFRAGVLQCGTYDLSAQTPAGRLIADEYFLNSYAGTAPDRTHPDLSPVFADLRHLPPVLIVIGEQDVLLEVNLAMTSRLAAAGNQVDLRVYPASPHAFTGHATAMARSALNSIDDWLHEQLTSIDQLDATREAAGRPRS